MASFTERMIGAATLNVKTYEEVEHDESALPQAMGCRCALRRRIWDWLRGVRWFQGSRRRAHCGGRRLGRLGRHYFRRRDEAPARAIDQSRLWAAPSHDRLRRLTRYFEHPWHHPALWLAGALGCLDLATDGDGCCRSASTRLQINGEGGSRLPRGFRRVFVRRFLARRFLWAWGDGPRAVSTRLAR